VGCQYEMNSFAWFEGGHRDTGADCNRLMECMEVRGIDLQAAFRSNLQAASALVAQVDMQVDLFRIILVFDQGAMRTGCDDSLAGFFIPAFFLKPVRIKKDRIVHGAAGFSYHTPEGNVF